MTPPPSAMPSSAVTAISSFPAATISSAPFIHPAGAARPARVDGSGGTARIIMAGPGRPSTSSARIARRAARRLRRRRLAEGAHADGAKPGDRRPARRGRRRPHRRRHAADTDGPPRPRCRHGIHLLGRDRNVLIANCHIYDNSGVGVFLDRLNLHQINIVGNHISYASRAGSRSSPARFATCKSTATTSSTTSTTRPTRRQTFCSTPARGRSARALSSATRFRRSGVRAGRTSASSASARASTPRSACSRSRAT